MSKSASAADAKGSIRASGKKALLQSKLGPIRVGLLATVADAGGVCAKGADA